MSLRYNNKNNVETIVSGITPGGNMETGAVAMREGIIDCPGSSSQDYCQVAVTFSDPMPDGDYIVEIQPKQGSWEKQQWTCTEKTATGFMFVVYNVNRTAPYNATKFNYKAFKPYEVADAEELYSSVQDIEAMIPSTASSSNKFATANDLRTETRSLDRRLDDVEDCVPSSASISNQLVTATQLETAINNVEIDIDDQIDSTSENPVQNKVIYNALQNVEIDVDSALSGTSENPVQNKVVKGALDKKEDAQFTGTQAQWDALSTTQKKAYKIANITDDVIGGEVADEVTDGLMSPVTSNAVYDALNTRITGSVALQSGSTVTPTFYASQCYQVGRVVYIYISFTKYAYTANDQILLDFDGITMPAESMASNRAVCAKYGAELWSLHKSCYGIMGHTGMTITIPESGTFALAVTLTYIV